MADPQKILLIEDDAFTREAYEEVLKDEGYDVTTSADGEDGLSKVRQGGFAIVLLDMMLPKIDGLDLLRSLKNDPPKVPNGPIILLTNLAHDQVIKMALDLGVKSYLIKSDINPGQLVEKVKSFLPPLGDTKPK